MQAGLFFSQITPAWCIHEPRQFDAKADIWSSYLSC